MGAIPTLIIGLFFMIAFAGMFLLMLKIRSEEIKNKENVLIANFLAFTLCGISLMGFYCAGVLSIIEAVNQLIK
jgi:hypothetical protein